MVSIGFYVNAHLDLQDPIAVWMSTNALPNLVLTDQLVSIPLVNLNVNVRREEQVQDVKFVRIIHPPEIKPLNL